MKRALRWSVFSALFSVTAAARRRARERASARSHKLKKPSTENRELTTGSRAPAGLAALFAAAAFGAASCGGDDPSQAQGAGDVSFEVYVSRAAIDEIGAFQLALVKSDADLTCADLARTCLNTQLTNEQLVRFEDGAGKPVVALHVPVDLRSEGPARVQDTTLRKVPIGKNYLLVVEALSRHEPPRFLGSSCKSRVEIRAGENNVLAEPIQFVPSSGGDAGTATDGGEPGLSCDPRFP